MQFVFCNIATKRVKERCDAFYQVVNRSRMVKRTRMVKRASSLFNRFGAMFQNELHVIVARFTEA